MRTIRVGMIGAGFAASMFAQSFHLVENAELAGITSLERERSEEYAARYGIPRVYENREELLNCEDIDAVYIGTTPSDHKESAIQALEHGKHILVEKPFCLNVKDAEEVFSLARSKNLMAMEAMRGDFLPMTRELQKQLQDGVIGDVHFVICQMGFRMDPRNGANRVFDPKLGGGALYDVGCYCINAIMSVLGNEPKTVKFSTRMGEYGVDEESAVIIEYEDGKSGVAVNSVVSNVPCLMTICGSKGSITIPKFHFAQSMDVAQNDLFFPNFPKEPPKHFDMPYESSNEQFETQAFVNDILSGKVENEIMPHARSIAILSAIDACLGRA